MPHIIIFFSKCLTNCTRPESYFFCIKYDLKINSKVYVLAAKCELNEFAWFLSVRLSFAYCLQRLNPGNSTLSWQLKRLTLVQLLHRVILSAEVAAFFVAFVRLDRRQQLQFYCMVHATLTMVDAYRTQIGVSFTGLQLSARFGVFVKK